MAPDFPGLQQPEQWRALLELLESGAPGEALADALRALRRELRRLGVTERRLEVQDRALRTDRWDELVREVGTRTGEPTLLFIGPQRAQEGEPARMGLLLATAAIDSRPIVEMIESSSDLLGQALFGFSCKTWGRRIEYYDLVLASGPFVDAAGRAIALFTPNYLGGWKDAHLRDSARRSILFLNMVTARFQHLAQPLADRIELAEHPGVSEITRPVLRSAFVTLLTLHELLHGSGPLPLFEAPGHKIGLGLEFAALEELRVDSTVWVALDVAEEIWADAATCRAVLLLDRLARSGRVAWSRYGDEVGIRHCVDGEHGALWWALLEHAGALLGNAPIHVVGVSDALVLFLAEYYQREQVARASADPAAALRAWARELRARFFEGATRLPERSIQRLSHMSAGTSTELPIRFSALPRSFGRE